MANRQATQPQQLKKFSFFFRLKKISTFAHEVFLTFSAAQFRRHSGLSLWKLTAAWSVDSSAAF